MHSAFKGRLVDSRDNDSSLERCEVSVKEGHDEKECRFVVKMIYRQGKPKALQAGHGSRQSRNQKNAQTYVRAD